jgi:poly(hydroxyalkanoate) granule-associated protein
MVTKTLKKKAPVKPAKNTFAAPVVDSAKDIWFAGLGAFSVAQQEGGKLFGQGTKLFDKLVSEGAKVEKKSFKAAESTVDEVKSDVEKRLKEARKQAGESWDNLYNIFDDRVSGTLERLGIPTSNDLNKLSGYVQDMSRKASSNWKELEKMARDTAGNLGKLESEFTKRVKTVLENLHVPSMDDLNKLADSLQKVSRDSAANLDKVEANINKQVSGAFEKMEANTTEEVKRLNNSLQDMSRQVSDNLGKLESMVEKRVKVVLGSLGVPSADDINKLSTELKKLSQQVSGLEKQLKVKTKVTPVKPAPKKALAPKATTSMTVDEKKKAAEAISKMKPANKPEVTS